MGPLEISSSHWLTLWEQEAVREKLVRYNLVKWDNEGKLPLTGGGTTDVYIALRDARNTPESIDFLARTFAKPLLELRPDRFVEVPDSVSCFAGSLSVMTGIPYITIRKQAKQGSRVIGAAKRGERVCIIDDVITSGDSEIVPYQECKAMGLEILLSIVLVDRQGGWQQNFEQQGISLEVWSGMTLQYVREWLIEQGLLKGCDEQA